MEKCEQMCHCQFASFAGLHGKLEDASHICIFRIFISVPFFSQSGTPRLAGGAGAKGLGLRSRSGNLPRAPSCASTQHPSLAPRTSSTSLSSWRTLGKLTSPATDTP